MPIRAPLRAALLSAAALSSVVQAQIPAIPEAASGVSAFPRSYFAASQPSSAFDMVTLLPGFRLQEGDTELRGYGGSGGNILIDGERPATKQETLEALLKRIPARSVERIELIRSAASGVDMQGYALVANVVRIRADTLHGRTEGEYARFRHGFDAPRLAGELSYSEGSRQLDLSAAFYREIDDEHGFGSRNRYAADGTPIRIADYGQPEGVRVGQLTGAYRQALAGGTIRLNGLFKDSRMFANITNFIRFPEPEDIFGSERDHTRASEAGLQFERQLFASSTVELLAIRRDTAIRATDRSLELDVESVNRERSDASETILRGVIRRPGAALSIEAGLEGARNVLDSRSALEEDGVAIPLPAANVRVAEDRAEGFVTLTWQAVRHLSVEAGARAEASRLTQSGDSALEKSLAFLKPRLLVTWAPDEADEMHLLVEREVGQLDFADFASSASLTGGTVTAGNKDLEPDSLWRAELSWQRRLGKGSLVLTARHEAIRNVIDHIPVFASGAIFDAVGNIGDGTRDELQADLNLPLEAAGLKGVLVQANLLYRRSRVEDPATGERRAISGDADFEGRIALTHDLPAQHLRWGLTYVAASEEREFKIDEIEADRLSGRLEAFVEYKPDPNWTLRLFAKNLTDSPAVRTRQIYAGLRGTSPLDYVEKRVLRSGPYVGVTVQRSFGG